MAAKYYPLKGTTSELLGQLPPEELLGVIEEAAGLRRVDAGTEETKDGFAVPGKDGLLDLVSEQKDSGLDPVREVVLEDEQESPHRSPPTLMP